MDNFNLQGYIASGKLHATSKTLTEAKKQGYDDREDESLGARKGAEKGKKQSMKDRRDDSYGKFGKRDAEKKGKNKINKENLAEKEDSKKGNSEEQKRMEGAIKDDRDHIKDLKKDIEDNERELARLKKDYKKDVIKEEEEGKEFKVGDKVTFKSGGAEMEITNSRKMFGSKLNAYSVKKSNGKTAEYDERELKLSKQGKSVKENKVADKDIEKEIKVLQDENPKGFEKEIKKLKVRQAALKLSKQGKKKVNEEVSTKIKVSELKAKIKESILAELSLNEAEEDVDVDIDVEDEVEVEAGADDIEIERPGVKTTVDVGLSPEEEVVQDSLKAAMDAAQALGSDKLADQIGNTITFFTRQFVVGDRND